MKPQKPQRREKVIGVRLTNAQYQDINHIAAARYLTASTLGRLLFEMLLKKEISIRGVGVDA